MNVLSSVVAKTNTYENRDMRDALAIDGASIPNSGLATARVHSPTAFTSPSFALLACAQSALFTIRNSRKPLKTITGNLF